MIRTPATYQLPDGCPYDAPETLHELRIRMLLDDQVRADGDLICELVGHYPHNRQIVTVDSNPWRVHGVEGTSITWLELLAAERRRAQPLP